MVLVSVRYLFYQPMDGKIKTWTLRFPAKEYPNMEKASFDWPIVFQYDARLYPFDKPIKSLYFRSLDVSVLFALSFQGHTKIALTRSEQLPY